MANDKNRMLQNANYYAGLVASARSHCADAFVRLSSSISEVDAHWKGEAGSAMVEELYQAKARIKAAHDRLGVLYSQMQSHTQSICNNWPDEEDL